MGGRSGREPESESLLPVLLHHGRLRLFEHEQTSVVWQLVQALPMGAQWHLQHLCNVQAHFASAETDVGTEKDALTMRPQSWVGRAPWQLSVADRTRARFEIGRAHV